LLQTPFYLLIQIKKIYHLLIQMAAEGGGYPSKIYLFYIFFIQIEIIVKIILLSYSVLYVK